MHYACKVDEVKVFGIFISNSYMNTVKRNWTIGTENLNKLFTLGLQES